MKRFYIEAVRFLPSYNKFRDVESISAVLNCEAAASVQLFSVGERSELVFEFQVGAHGENSPNNLIDLSHSDKLVFTFENTKPLVDDAMVLVLKNCSLSLVLYVTLAEQTVLNENGAHDLA